MDKEERRQNNVFNNFVGSAGARTLLGPIIFPRQHLLNQLRDNQRSKLTNLSICELKHLMEYLKSFLTSEQNFANYLLLHNDI